MRQFTSDFNDATDAEETSEVFPLFVTITHPDLDDPIRVVQDANGVDYQWNGSVYKGMPFDFELMSDTEQAPVGSCAIANVTSEIGQKIRNCNPAIIPQVNAYLLSRADFSANINGGVGPNGALTEIGTADVQLKMELLRLVRASVDNIKVQGELKSFDFTSEPFNRRATPGRLPGIFYTA